MNKHVVLAVSLPEKKIRIISFEWEKFEKMSMVQL